MKDALLARLGAVGQEHLLDSWEDLSENERTQLRADIEQVDWELVATLFRGDEDAPNWAALASAAEPPPAICPATDAPSDIAAARQLGEKALRDGRVGMILVAGGQGSRLGFDHPKGMLPLGPVSDRTLFEILIDRLRAIGRRYGTSIPLYLMTSPATHQETVDYFAARNRLGLAEADLSIFCQGVMPTLDAATGRALRQSPGQLSLSPDGHGGMLSAFSSSGCLAEAERRGIDLLFYGQVDNPLLQVCDPLLVGCHLKVDAEMTTQVVRKVDPSERVGNVVQVDGRVRIIEYSDLPADVAEKRGDDGALLLWAGSLGVHIFSRPFLESVVDRADLLPFHRASKKSEFIDDEGRLVQPSEPNSLKFERFIFDLLPAAQRAAVVEYEKKVAFSPVKNAEGAPSDTALHAQQAMIGQATEMLRDAGMVVNDGVPVEVDPMWAFDAAEIQGRLEPRTVIDSPTFFAERTDSL